ncbi:hypothetical protein [Teichococcus aestuarii]|uniref:hypothetical protein n=1 Tax=Teichococcus aestuarii TaxID=568898 RepID=UPI00361C4F58
MQQVADLDQVLHRQQQLARAALHMRAVGQDLAVDLAGQHAQAAGDPGFLAQRHGGGQSALQRGEAATVPPLGRQGGHQPARILRQPHHQRAAEGILGRGGQEVPVAEPGGEPRARHLRHGGDGFGAAPGQPVGGQVARPQPGAIGAEGAQVAQPCKAVHGGAPRRGAAALGPALAAFLGGHQRADGAGHLALAAQQAVAAPGIAGPEVAEGTRRRLGHPHRLQPGHHPAGAAQPIRHQPAPPRSPAMAAA